MTPGAALPGPIAGAIESARGRGRALDPEAAARLGGALGADLRGVQIHDDAGADALCEGLAARAFTTGGDIFFARGGYDPGSRAGGALLAHELTHVIQQGGARAGGGGPLWLGDPGSTHERAAERAAVEPGGSPGRARPGEVQRLAVTSPAPGSLTVTSGALTTLGEGSDAATKYIHWPNTEASGVTLGKGYDIGGRTAQQVKDELTAAGMSVDQATKISAGAGLKGAAAQTFVSEHKTAVGEIAKSVQSALLATMLTQYTARAKSTATSAVADAENRNAAGREKKEGAAAGTYVLTEAQWTALHPAMVEFLTDLIYQGGYYGYDRVAKINAKLIAKDGDPLAQFKAVRELFEGDYMDTYAAAIGEGKSAAGATETLYGQAVATGGKYRRNQIRLAYLNHVITALEAGQAVVVDAAGGTTTAATPAGTAAPAPAKSGPDYRALARSIYEAMAGTIPIWPVLLTALAAARAAEDGIAELRRAFATLYQLDLVGEVRRRVEDSWFGGLAETVMSYFVEDEAAAVAAPVGAAPAPVAAAVQYVSAPIVESVGSGGKCYDSDYLRDLVPV